MKEVKKGKRIRTFLLGGAFALTALSSAAVLALPYPGAGNMLYVTYYDGAGNEVGARTFRSCPGVEPVSWGITTANLDYVIIKCPSSLDY